VANHELNHYWLHCSTAYGLLLDELAIQQVNHSGSYCIDLWQHDSPVVVPAHRLATRLAQGDDEWLRRRGLDPALYESMAEREVAPWADAAFLEQVLDGRSQQSTTADKAVAALAHCERRATERQPHAELFSSDTVRPISDYQRSLLDFWSQAPAYAQVPAAPSSRPSTHPAPPFGALHLFEGQAHQLEVEEADVDAVRRLAETEYLTAWLATIQRYVSHRSHGPQSQHEFESLHMTFSALVDLALYVPCGAVYARLRTDQMSWADIHPGYRFERLLNNLDREDWVDVPEEMPRLQRALSAGLSWPSPDRFLALGAEVNPLTPELARHAAACQARFYAKDRSIVTPWTELDRTIANVFIEHPPIQVVDGRAVVPGDTVTAMISRVLGYVLAGVGWQVMMTTERDIRRCLPPGLCDGRTFINVRNEDEFVEILADAMPFLREATFVAMDEHPGNW
jgi:hypothetical protein